MVDVVVFGSLAVDHIFILDELPEWDEIKVVKQYHVEAGGSAANVAYALARLGVKVSFIGKAGGDDWAKYSLESLKKAGVDVSYVVIDNRLKTVETYILVFEDKKMTLIPLVDGLALSLKSPSEINFSLVDECDIVYIGEVFVEVSESIAKYSKSKGKYVIYRITTPYARLGIEKLKNIISHTDLLLLNSKSWSLLKASGADIDKILDMNTSYVIVTRGELGVEINGKLFNPLPSKIKALDTTGCGDAFAAGLIKKLLENKEVEDAAYFGMMLASYVASEPGARRGVDKFVRHV
ncbi:MAG: hypothetical protein DRJ38_02875 [Thermoprotei archaeon]|nr:MAG: hypothetical protein DRJ38_02875 [Thermoprotei archaeon]